MFERHSDPKSFLDVTAPLVERAEDRHVLALGLARDLLSVSTGRTTAHRPQDVFLGVGGAPHDPRLLVVQTLSTRAVIDEVDGGVDDTTLDLALEALAAHAPGVPNLTLSEPLMERVLGRWTRATGRRATLFQRTRLHRLEHVVAPRPCAGRMRAATTGDSDRCREWARGFMVDIGFHGPDAPAPDTFGPLERGAAYFWEVDGEPVSMAAWTRGLPTTCSINWVYTPPDRRGRGYASALVAGLSQLVLDGLPGHAPRTSVNLFTDLANPTSNRIYAALGYEPVRDFVSYDMAAT